MGRVRKSDVSGHLARRQAGRSAFAALILVGLLLAPTRGYAQLTPLSVPDLPATIPIFPLPNVAVLPYLQLPLRVFEPRYREMLADALSGARIVGIVQLQPGFEGDYEGRPPIFGIGCAAVVVTSDTQPDGSSNIVLRGFTKFRITGETGGKPYRLAQVEAIVETVDEPTRTALRAERPALISAMAASLGIDASSLRLPPMSDEDLVNSLVMSLDLDPVDRQVLLEQDGVLARQRKLAEILRTPPTDAPRQP